MSRLLILNGQQLPNSNYKLSWRAIAIKSDGPRITNCVKLVLIFSHAQARNFMLFCLQCGKQCKVLKLCLVTKDGIWRQNMTRACVLSLKESLILWSKSIFKLVLRSLLSSLTCLLCPLLMMYSLKCLLLSIVHNVLHVFFQNTPSKCSSCLSSTDGLVKWFHLARSIKLL